MCCESEKENSYSHDSRDTVEKVEKQITTLNKAKHKCIRKSKHKPNEGCKKGKRGRVKVDDAQYVRESTATIRQWKQQLREATTKSLSYRDRIKLRNKISALESRLKKRVNSMHALTLTEKFNQRIDTLLGIIN